MIDLKKKEHDTSIARVRDLIISQKGGREESSKVGETETPVP